MITYELATKLKDAGFPQAIGNGNIPRFMDCNGDYTKLGTRNPTLSELIEQCLITFHLQKLEDRQNNWKYRAVTMETFYEGSTPEEAVAKLWLELNKKI